VTLRSASDDRAESGSWESGLEPEGTGGERRERGKHWGQYSKARTRTGTVTPLNRCVQLGYSPHPIAWYRSR